MEFPIPVKYCINDVKLVKETSYLGYKRSKVRLQMLKSINEGCLDKALFWAIEYDISGGGLGMIENLIIYSIT